MKAHMGNHACTTYANMLQLATTKARSRNLASGTSLGHVQTSRTSDVLSLSCPVSSFAHARIRPDRPPWTRV